MAITIIKGLAKMLAILLVGAGAAQTTAQMQGKSIGFVDLDAKSTEIQIVSTVPPQPKLTTENEIGERILELPEDGDIWHTSLYLHDDWQRIKLERELVAWFETDKRLASLKAQTKFHLYTESSDVYQQPEYRSAFPVLPTIVVQRGDGEVIYKATGQSIENSGHDLARAIKWTIRDRCPGGNCRPYRPQPLPEPDPNPEPADPVPDMGPPKEEAKSEDDSLLKLILALAAGGGAGGLTQLRKEG